MAVRNEVTTIRLYMKAPGSDRLRKGSEATLRRLLATGWHEIHRTGERDYVDVRLSRPVARESQLGLPGNASVGGRIDPATTRRLRGGRDGIGAR
jgi:hypothetical protein